jgi:L-rhamnose mutarotase
MTAEKEKYGFRMKLKQGMAEEYRIRHDKIWQDLVDLLHQAGVEDYSIFLDQESHYLFAVMWRRRDHGLADLPKHEVIQKWWASMADIMDTDEFNQPHSIDLELMFHMP